MLTAKWNRDNLARLKANHGITSDRQLAINAGIPPNTLHHQLTHDKPTIDTVLTISSRYQIRVEQLVLSVPK